MWPYYPDLLATPVPRYTSYPTAAEFGPIDHSALSRAIANAHGDISLYLHIPFCEKICFYCGCNTGAAGRRLRLETYLAALLAEIGTVADQLPPDAKIRRIAFGGGSPNAILPGEFLDLVDAIIGKLPVCDPVWSIELDPRSMSREWGQAIAAVGVARASLGVQTFAPHCQAAIGRVQDESLIIRSLDWLRAAGVRSLNFDLMYGLPAQSHDDLADSLDRAVKLGADRIALFGYAHVPHIVKRQQMIDAGNLPGSADRFRMAATGFSRLTDAGYLPVGFDHFALPHDAIAKSARNGTLRRNFQGFTEDQSNNLIGLGSSAVSCFPELLAQNEKNSGRYRMQASQGRLTALHGKLRSSDDRLRGGVIESLLCQGEAILPSILLEQAKGKLEPYLACGLARIEGASLSIAPEGRPYARGIAAIFDPYRTVCARKLSSAI